MVLLTNMLIAMMNDRFSTEIKAQTRLLYFRNAHRCVLAKYERKWEPPSPFNLIFIFSAIFNSVADSVAELKIAESWLRGRKLNQANEEKEQDEMLARLSKPSGSLTLAKDWWYAEKTEKVEKAKIVEASELDQMEELLKQDMARVELVKSMLERARGREYSA